MGAGEPGRRSFRDDLVQEDGRDEHSLRQEDGSGVVRPRRGVRMSFLMAGLEVGHILLVQHIVMGDRRRQWSLKMKECRSG